MPGGVVFFLVSVTAIVAGVIFYYFKTRHEERMAIIEKGENIEYPKSRSSKLSALKWGIVFLSVGLSLMIGIYIDIWRNHDGPFFTLPLLIVGAGLGFLGYYNIIKHHVD